MSNIVKFSTLKPGDLFIFHDCLFEKIKEEMIEHCVTNAVCVKSFSKFTEKGTAHYILDMELVKHFALRR